MAGGLVQAVMLINSTDMIVELFDAYAPSLKISEMELGTTKKRRMEILFERLEKFAEENPVEHTALFKILNTIATLNTDNSIDKTIRDFLAHHFDLKKVYDSLHYAGMFNNRSTLAMLASFVAIRAKIGEEDKKDAQLLWGALQVSASKAAQGNFLHKNITPPTLTPPQSAHGLQTFRDELEKYIRLTNQQKDYIAFVIPSTTSEGYTCYYVNTSPPERDVPKVENGKRVIGPDANMTGFEIRHFYARDKVWISETKSGDQEYILDLFLRHVLGSQVEKQKRCHCEHRLPVFKDPKKFAEQITMPKKCEEQIDKLLKERYARENLKVLRAELKAKLHTNAYNENHDWDGETKECDIDTCPRFLRNVEICISSNGRRSASGFCYEHGTRYIPNVPQKYFCDRKQMSALKGSATDDGHTPSPSSQDVSESEKRIISAVNDAAEKATKEIIEKCGQPSLVIDDKDIFKDRSAAENYVHKVGKKIKKAKPELCGRYAVAEYIIERAKQGDVLYDECCLIRKLAKKYNWNTLGTIRQKVIGQQRTTEKTVKRRTASDRKKKLVEKSLAWPSPKER